MVHQDLDPGDVDLCDLDRFAQGFPHDVMPIPPNSMSSNVREVNSAGTYNYYLHDEGAAETVGQIVIQ